MTKIKIDTVEKNRDRQTEIKIDRLNKIERQQLRVNKKDIPRWANELHGHRQIKQKGNTLKTQTKVNKKDISTQIA